MHSRRTFLKLAAVTGAGALAGCKHVVRAITPKPEDVLEKLLKEPEAPKPPPPQPIAPPNGEHAILDFMREQRERVYTKWLDDYEASRWGTVKA